MIINVDLEEILKTCSKERAYDLGKHVGIAITKEEKSIDTFFLNALKEFKKKLLSDDITTTGAYLRDVFILFIEGFFYETITSFNLPKQFSSKVVDELFLILSKAEEKAFLGPLFRYIKLDEETFLNNYDLIRDFQSIILKANPSLRISDAIKLKLELDKLDNIKPIVNKKNYYKTFKNIPSNITKDFYYTIDFIHILEQERKKKDKVTIPKNLIPILYEKIRNDTFLNILILESLVQNIDSKSEIEYLLFSRSGCSLLDFIVLSEDSKREELIEKMSDYLNSNNINIPMTRNFLDAKLIKTNPKKVIEVVKKHGKVLNKIKDFFTNDLKEIFIYPPSEKDFFRKNKLKYDEDNYYISLGEIFYKNFLKEREK